MYSTVRRFIKTGVVFLGLGLAVGVYMLARREIWGAWPHPYMVSAHAHAVLVGFMMFLILGVALWLFPRAAKDDTRYDPYRIDLAYALLVVGTASRFLAELAQTWIAADVLGWVVLGGGLAQVAGLAVYFWTMWTRIRPVGSHIREAKGEKF